MRDRLTVLPLTGQDCQQFRRIVERSRSCATGPEYCRLGMRLAMEERVLEQSRDATEGTMVSQDFRRQLEGYGLTTANILYRRPDHPWLPQTFGWQGFSRGP